ncbi:MAG TPA: hypothetical protein VJR24_04090 [Gemmatimonadaceae bacterium]|nr:hypothetical protein [Gemmatimonadaceae bacterium]
MADNVQSDRVQAMADERRTAILALARKLADQKAHYLWGAEGQTPSSRAPYYFAPVSVGSDPATFKSTTFGAAWLHDATGSPFVCAGRCFDAAPSPAAAIIAHPETDPKLKEFVEKYHKTHPSQYTYPEPLTPRVIVGSGDGEPMDYTTGTPRHLAGTLVWGESCNGKQHFDCGGFIRWVVKQVCGMSIAGVSTNPTQQNALGQPMGRFLTKDDTVMKADILVYPGHIAFATGEPALKYDPKGRYKVAQADCATNGVNYNATHPADNTSCVRLSDSTLIGSVFASAVRAAVDGFSLRPNA